MGMFAYGWRVPAGFWGGLGEALLLRYTTFADVSGACKECENIYVLESCLCCSCWEA